VPADAERARGPAARHAVRQEQHDATSPRQALWCRARTDPLLKAAAVLGRKRDGLTASGHWPSYFSSPWRRRVMSRGHSRPEGLRLEEIHLLSGIPGGVSRNPSRADTAQL